MIENLPLISIILASYNAEKYIEEAIDSIINQTYDNLEIIIVDDCSTDDTWKILEKYANNDNRIRLYRNKENSKLPFSLNFAINKANGKYLARMDADDISLPTRIEEQVRFMETNEDIGICGTAVELFGENVKKHILSHPKEHHEMKTRLLFSVCFNHPTVMIRKNLLIDNNLTYNLEYVNSQDYELWSRLCDITKMTNIDKVLLKYRIVSNSITATTDKYKEELRYELLKGVFTKVLKNLNIVNTEEENKLHFIIGLNDRMQRNSIDMNDLDKYLSKIVESNKKINYFDINYLMSFLSRKYIIAWYFQLKKSDFQLFSVVKSKFFYYFIFYKIRVFFNEK
mgnify:CR=1 FL=1